MQAFVQQPGGHQVTHALYSSKHCRPQFNAAFDFRGLGCLGMLAKAESGGTVSPPAEGHVRVGIAECLALAPAWALGPC